MTVFAAHFFGDHFLAGRGIDGNARKACMLGAGDSSTDEVVRRFAGRDRFKAARLIAADILAADGIARRHDHGIAQTLESHHNGLFDAVACNTIALHARQKNRGSCEARLLGKAQQQKRNKESSFGRQGMLLCRGIPVQPATEATDVPVGARRRKTSASDRPGWVHLDGKTDSMGLPTDG